MRKMLFAGVLLLASLQSAPAQVRITEGNGGSLAEHIELFAQIRDSGERVIIDGPCRSACTLILGMIPPERICVTPRARLGFHAAWVRGPQGRPVVSRPGSRLMMDMYPPRVKSWIIRTGGLPSPNEFRYLQGRQLASMYRTCR